MHSARAARVQILPVLFPKLQKSRSLANEIMEVYGMPEKLRKCKKEKYFERKKNVFEQNSEFLLGVSFVLHYSFI